MWPPFKLALISVRYRSSKNQLRSVGVKPGKVARGGRTSCGKIPIIDPRNRKSSFQCATNTKGHSIRALETNDEKTFTFFLLLGSWCHKCSKFFSRPTWTQSTPPPLPRWKCANVSSLDIFANDFARECPPLPETVVQTIEEPLHDIFGHIRHPDRAFAIAIPNVFNENIERMFRIRFHVVLPTFRLHFNRFILWRSPTSFMDIVHAIKSNSCAITTRLRSDISILYPDPDLRSIEPGHLL